LSIKKVLQKAENVRFSVIIPHKNTPDLLKRCLGSIPRTQDIQIIVVDDNSDEQFADFNDLSDLKDEFVEIYLTYKEGKGASYARNVGMKHAKGNWLLFADADDFFTENAFEHLFAQADASEDIVYFKSCSCYSDNTNISATRNFKFNKLVDNYLAKTKDAEDYIRYLWSAPWAKMIKRELVERQNILFDETSVANDVMFSCLLGHYAATVKAVDEIIYTLTHIRPSLLERLSQKVFGTEKIRKEKVIINETTHLNKHKHKIVRYERG